MDCNNKSMTLARKSEGKISEFFNAIKAAHKGSCRNHNKKERGIIHKQMPSFYLNASEQIVNK